nr:unnamed protein product [Haemonchus contortus]
MKPVSKAPRNKRFAVDRRLLRRNSNNTPKQKSKQENCGICQRPVKEIDNRGLDGSVETTNSSNEMNVELVDIFMKQLIREPSLREMMSQEPSMEEVMSDVHSLASFLDRWRDQMCKNYERPSTADNKSPEGTVMKTSKIARLEEPKARMVMVPDKSDNGEETEKPNNIRTDAKEPKKASWQFNPFDEASVRATKLILKTLDMHMNGSMLEESERSKQMRIAIETLNEGIMKMFGESPESSKESASKKQVDVDRTDQTTMTRTQSAIKEEKQRLERLKAEVEDLEEQMFGESPESSKESASKKRVDVDKTDQTTMTRTQSAIKEEKQRLERLKAEVEDLEEQVRQIDLENSEAPERRQTAPRGKATLGTAGTKGKLQKKQFINQAKREFFGSLRALERKTGKKKPFTGIPENGVIPIPADAIPNHVNNRSVRPSGEYLMLRAAQARTFPGDMEKVKFAQLLKRGKALMKS